MLGYDDTGSGPPLVLIHGWAARRTIWDHIVPLLSGRRVIAVDVPGFGESPAAGDGFDLEQVARAIWDGIPVDGPVTVVGHSMGGAVALTAAAIEPDRTTDLILCAPAGLKPLPAQLPPLLGALGSASIRVRRAAAPLASNPVARRVMLGANTAGATPVSEDDAMRMITGSDGATRLSGSLQTVTTVDLRPLLHETPDRLSLIWGQHDRVVSPSIADVVRAERPDAQIEVVPDTGHVPMIEAPQAFATVLRQLLDRPGDVHTLATKTP